MGIRREGRVVVHNVYGYQEVYSDDGGDIGRLELDDVPGTLNSFPKFSFLLPYLTVNSTLGLISGTVSGMILSL